MIKFWGCANILHLMMLDGNERRVMLQLKRVVNASAFHRKWDHIRINSLKCLFKQLKISIINYAKLDKQKIIREKSKFLL